jgi:hypothetical protein
MEKEIEAAQFTGGHLHEGGDLFVALDIQWFKKGNILWVLIRQLADASPVSLTLVVGPIREVGKTAGSPLLHHSSGDRPGDRVFIGDAENQSFFSFKKHWLYLPVYRDWHVDRLVVRVTNRVGQRLRSGERARIGIPS